MTGSEPDLIKDYASTQLSLTDKELAEIVIARTFKIATDIEEAAEAELINMKAPLDVIAAKSRLIDAIKDSNRIMMDQILVKIDDAETITPIARQERDRLLDLMLDQQSPTLD